jgi:hypothetical protein
MVAETYSSTNPLDYPRYVRSLRPSLPESLPLFIDDELDKLSVSLKALEEAASNDAEARVEEERIARVAEDEALAARIVSVETEFTAGLSDTTARIETEEIVRATADEALASRISTVETDYVAADALTNARVTTEELARSTADEALASRIDTVSASLSAAEVSSRARVSEEVYARTTQDEALAARITTVESDFATDISDANARITTEETTRASADIALASSITSLEATVESDYTYVVGLIITEQGVRATQDGVIASSVTALTTTVNSNTASITTAQSSIDGLLLKYGVTLDSNGYISGFSQNNSGTSSDFLIRADEFKVIMPGESAITPFSVTGDGVQINGNLVVSGTITSGKIGTGAVETDKVAAGAITVPYTYDGSASTYCPTGSETTVLEMPSTTSIGDGTDGGAVIMFFGEIDSASEKDLGLELKIYTDVDSAGYVLGGSTKGGLRTSGGNSYFDMPVALMQSVSTGSTLKVKVTARPYIVDTASDTRPGYIRNPKVVVLGAKR